MARRIWISGIDRLLTERATAEAAQATDSSPAWEHGGHAVTAIILIVSAFEAHIGEWLARPLNGAQFGTDEIDDLRWKPGYEAAKVIIRKADDTRNVGEEAWFRSLRGLYELRNHVAHYTPEKRDTGTFPPRLDPYIRDGTITPAGDASMDWTSRLIVRSVAEQAISIAATATLQFDQALVGWPAP